MSRRHKNHKGLFKIFGSLVMHIDVLPHAKERFQKRFRGLKLPEKNTLVLLVEHAVPTCSYNFTNGRPEPETIIIARASIKKQDVFLIMRSEKICTRKGGQSVIKLVIKTVYQRTMIDEFISDPALQTGHKVEKFGGLIEGFKLHCKL